MREARPITARQIHAARKLLDWTQQRLADKAVVAVSVVRRIERGQTDPRPGTIAAIEIALARAGVIFIPSDGRQGEGVRLAKGLQSTRFSPSRKRL